MKAAEGECPPSAAQKRKRADMGLNILLIGEGAAGIQALRALGHTEHRIVAVMASPAKEPAKRATLWDVSEQFGYATWPAKLVKDPSFASTVRSAGVDILLNVYSLFIINREALSAARIGSFNMHPGPLPRYAGLNAVSWALYRGERTHGVTIHQMTSEIDAGPIVSQAVFSVEEHDTALSLTGKCVKAGVALIVQLLETASLHPGALPLLPQDLTQREYFGAQVPENGRLSWSRPACEVVNFVRACDFLPFPSPWGHPRVRMGDCEIAILKAFRTGRPADMSPGTVGQLTPSGVYVTCADEWILVSQLMREGQRVHPADILKPNDRLADGR